MTSFGWKKRKTVVKSADDITAFKESEQLAVSITLQLGNNSQAGLRICIHFMQNRIQG